MDTIIIYMSIQTSIMKASSKVHQKLFDEAIHTTGRTTDCLKISYIEDIFQNREEEAVLNYEDIIATIIYPSEVPIDRYRLDGTVTISETRTFFFDVLPIEVYTKFQYQLEKDDYLFHYFVDEHQNKVPMLLQVTETFGRFSTDLVWRKYYCAPKNGDIPEAILDIIKQRF